MLKKTVGIKVIDIELFDVEDVEFMTTQWSVSVG